MKRSRKLAILLFLSCACGKVLGQGVQYSQYNYANALINPASIALDDYATASSVFRSQRTVQDAALSTIFLGLKYPLIAANGKGRWGSLAATFGEDNSGLGGVFETERVGLTFALNWEIGKTGILSWGLESSYQSRKVNTIGLTTGSQFIPGSGFDPLLSSGEDFENFQRNFFAFGTGLVWQNTSEEGEAITHASVAFFDLNEPNEGFIDRDSPLPSRMILEAGRRVFDNERMSIYLEGLYSNSARVNEIIVGAVTNLKLGFLNRKFRGQSVRIHTKYRNSEGAFLGLQWHTEKFSLGTSYDLPLSSRSANQGAFEVGFAIKKLVKSRRKVKKRRKKKVVPGSYRERLIEYRKKRLEELSNTPKTPDDSVAMPTPPEVIGLPVELKPAGAWLVYHFEFGSTNTLLEKEDIAQQVLAVLRSNKHASIEIMGHTDNVGSERYNQKLSLKRARAFYDLLISKGIDSNRVRYSGKGESEPLNDNSTPALREENRRVEIWLKY